MTAATYALTPTQRTQLQSWHAQMTQAIDARAFNAPRLRTLRSKIAFQLRMDSQVFADEFLADWTPGIVAEIASTARFAKMRADDEVARQRARAARIGKMAERETAMQADAA